MMGRYRCYAQFSGVENPLSRQLQINRQVRSPYFFVCSECLLVFPRAASLKENIQEPGGAWEHTATGRSEDGEADGRSGRGERPGFEKSRQIPAVIDVQVGEQHSIQLLEIDFQFSHAKEGPGAGIHQDSWRSVQLN